MNRQFLIIRPDNFSFLIHLIKIFDKKFFEPGWVLLYIDPIFQDFFGSMQNVVGYPNVVNS